MGGRVGQNVADGAFGEFARKLVLFDNLYPPVGLDVGAFGSVHVILTLL